MGIEFSALPRAVFSRYCSGVTCCSIETEFWALGTLYSSNFHDASRVIISGGGDYNGA